MISNHQLLSLPEFIFCPFKKHLARVFNLEDSSNGNNSQTEDDVPELHGEKAEINTLQSNGMANFTKLKQRAIHPNIKEVSKFNKIEPKGRQYIDFKKFCEIMKLFNFRTPVEQKIKCKKILIL